jgi:phosphoribosylformylglycinamidine synthase
MDLHKKQRRELAGISPCIHSAARHPLAEVKTMKARVFVTLKPGVLDPQGKAIHHALEGLGFSGVNDVRAGKMIELDLDDATSDAEIEDMCRKLLANTVIENFRVERLENA